MNDPTLPPSPAQPNASQSDLYDLLSQLGPDALQQMISAGLVPSRIGVAERFQPAQGQEVGHTYVAASPLEHMANAFRQYQEQKLLGQQGQGRLAYLRAIAARGAPQDQSQPLPGIPGDMNERY